MNKSEAGGSESAFLIPVPVPPLSPSHYTVPQRHSLAVPRRGRSVRPAPLSLRPS